MGRPVRTTAFRKTERLSAAVKRNAGRRRGGGRRGDEQRRVGVVELGGLLIGMGGTLHKTVDFPQRVDITLLRAARAIDERTRIAESGGFCTCAADGP